MDKENTPPEKTSIPALTSQLNDSIPSADNGGSTDKSETMLQRQAETLNALFEALTEKALAMGHHGAPKYFDVALKAQRQCRNTLETLHSFKNPKTYNYQYNSQTNNADQMVVGNVTQNKNSPNKLLEDKSDEWLDSRAKETAGGHDKELEAVEAKHGAQDR